MLEDREKRNIFMFIVMLVFMVLIFGPLFTINSQLGEKSDSETFPSENVFETACKESDNFNPNVKKISFTSRKPSKDCKEGSNRVCFSKPFKPKPLSKAECNKLKFKLGIKECGYDNDMWAGAVKRCGGVNHMATPEDLAALAEVLYKLPCGGHPNVNPYSYYTGRAVYDEEKAASLGLRKGSYIALWTNKEAGDEMVSRPGEYAYGRNYFPKNSSWYPYERYGKSNKRMAVCVFKD